MSHEEFDQLYKDMEQFWYEFSGLCRRYIAKAPRESLKNYWTMCLGKKTSIYDIKKESHYDKRKTKEGLVNGCNKPRPRANIADTKSNILGNSCVVGYNLYKMRTKMQISKQEMIDIRCHSSDYVELVINENKTTIWINIDGACVVRVQNIKGLQ